MQVSVLCVYGHITKPWLEQNDLQGPVFLRDHDIFHLPNTEKRV